MNRAFFATLGLVAIFITGACSSATDEKQSAKTNSTTNSTTSNVNTATVQNGTEVSPPSAEEANAASAGPIEGPASNRLSGKLDALKRGEGGPIDNAKAEAMARKNARPAPDNSTFVSFLTDAGYEVRTFNNHPQLLRVEKRIGTDSQTIKVFLRNGRVVELPGNALSALATVGADAILSAAGVKSDPASQRPPAGGADTKKPGN